MTRRLESCASTEALGNAAKAAQAQQVRGDAWFLASAKASMLHYSAHESTTALAKARNDDHVELDDTAGSR